MDLTEWKPILSYTEVKLKVQCFKKFLDDSHNGSKLELKSSELKSITQADLSLIKSSICRKSYTDHVKLYTEVELYNARNQDLMIAFLPFLSNVYPVRCQPF